ncbi:hypothetical protein JZK55_14820 [Dissulfurispira thermophila]|uniref:DUF3782 domain-containing protein n=1 Tax=Dissulfurispira thermophila TaxID=2715679 RepID=A0A7G1H169_9BACT|nr:hypothetical protein [Dissulfurispira thermophila]BCB96560.1 hypothetical protein JZK55_14820 [Dissulfurispira thermophila]
MPTIEELEHRTTDLELLMGQLILQTLKLEKEMKEFKDEMKEFKDEMKEFKDEMKEFKDEMKEFKDEMKEFKDGTLSWRQTIDEDRRRMARQWGDLANKMGTLVEDIVFPNIPRLAREYFGCEDIEDIMIRRKRINTKDRSKKREFDVIAVCNNKIILNETKATARTGYIDEFADFLGSGEFFEYFPEHEGKVIIPIFASLYIDDDIVRYLSQKKIYALGMKDDTMEILNPEL